MATYYDTRPNSADLTLYQELFEEHKSKPRVHKNPWILFGFIATDRTGGQTRYTPKLFKLNCGLTHGGAHDLDRYLKRGFVVLDYFLPRPEQVPGPQEIGDFIIEHGWKQEYKDPRHMRKVEELRQAIKLAQGEAGVVFEANEALNSERKLRLELEEKYEKMAAKLESELGDLKSRVDDKKQKESLQKKITRKKDLKERSDAK